MSELSENRDSESNPKMMSDSEINTESEMAQQILHSAASLRTTESENRQAGASSSPRSSLTDAQFIEQQTKTSFLGIHYFTMNIFNNAILHFFTMKFINNTNFIVKKLHC